MSLFIGVIALNLGFLFLPYFVFLAKNKEDREKLNGLNYQQYKINKTQIFVMNSIIAYNVGECHLLNIHI